MRPRAGPRAGVRVQRGFVTPAERDEALRWLGTLHPLWELRFSEHRPLPPGEVQRRLHRPVYWLGSWQFACLGYYTPPHGTRERCVEAEPFPPFLRGWADRAERLARATFPPAWFPDGWGLNTCLVNFYGSTVDPDGRQVDRARVGAHRDHEPGPVASVSLGARALFQLTTRHGEVVDQMWLEDRSLQVFGGPTVKDRWFHRVQRVERAEEELPPPIAGFRTRRVNFTFRSVPPEVVVPYAALSDLARRDVAGGVGELAAHSAWWARAIGEPRTPEGQGT